MVAPPTHSEKRCSKNQYSSDTKGTRVQVGDNQTSIFHFIIYLFIRQKTHYYIKEQQVKRLKQTQNKLKSRRSKLKDDYN